MNWFFSCLGFTLVIALLVCWPLWRHPTLPLGRKWLFSLGIFVWLVGGGMWLYGHVGLPAMALL